MNEGFWCVIPNKTFSQTNVLFSLDQTNENSASGRKMSKESVTLIPCANTADTKALKLVVVENLV